MRQWSRSMRMPAIVVAAMAVMATACLGPNQFDPTGRAPIGNLEVIVNAAGGIRVSGWVLDPETSAPIVVKVGSEGIVHDVRADGDRPDVAAVYPRHGSRHGFEHTFGPLSPGLHGICVWAENTVGGGDDRLLGCDNITVTDGTPIGFLDAATSSAPRSITVAGWVFDPSTSGGSEAVVTVDGKLAARVAADQYRPDVARAHGRPRSGFRTDIGATPGSHQVCVATFNIGFGNDRLLGCRTVRVAESTTDHRPTGNLTEVTPTGAGSVRVAGVASDRDGTTGLRVRLDIDPGTGASRTVTLPVSDGRFATDITGLSPGLHRICPVGLDVNGGVGVRGDREFICGSTVAGDIAVGTGGAAGSPSWVAPPASSPLRLTERDAGVSVELGDGSVMWFFGDTLEKDRVGNTLYFVNNTAAWAAPGAPTVTRDGHSGGNPVPFVPASVYGDFCAGASYPNEAMWPESAVAVPQADGTDRVLVFMSKVCLGNEFLQIEARGMALAEVTYRPWAPPVDVPVTGTITQPNLFGPDRPYGRGAVLGDDDRTLHTYQCGSFPSDWGPCTVGRVDVDDRTDPAAWKFWNGGDATSDTSWVTDAAAAAPMQTPTGNGVTIPVAAFTLTHDAAHDAYLMVYTPWPGFVDRVTVRVATSPVGPWTEPVEVTLPGCDDTTGGVEYRCYAGTAQPKLSKPGLLGLGYYDQMISSAPVRGQYMAVTVPFRVVLTPAP